MAGRERYEELMKQLEDRYKKIVDEAADNEKDLNIDNSSFSHAIYVIKKLFEKADKKVYILTDKFEEKFYENLRDVIEEFLENDKGKSGNKEKKIEILTFEDTSNNSLLKDLLKKYGNKVFIGRLKDPNLLTVDGKHINFILNDKKGVRYELLEDIESGETKAIVNFGNESFHDVLKKIFKLARANSEKVEAVS